MVLDGGLGHSNENSVWVSDKFRFCLNSDIDTNIYTECLKTFLKSNV